MIHAQLFNILSDKPFVKLPSENEVHLWLVPVDFYAPYQPDLFFLLTDSERAQSYRFVHHVDKVRFIISRGICRVLLANYLDFPPAQLTFANTISGKPYLAGNCLDKLQFNYSHSGKYILFACTLSSMVGTDIEFIQPEFDYQDIATYFFTKKELASISHANNQLSRINFYKIWTLKESLLKATGTGLTVPLNTFDVSVGIENSSFQVMSSYMNKYLSWTLYNLHLADTYCAALAIEAKSDFRLQLFKSY